MKIKSLILFNIICCYIVYSQRVKVALTQTGLDYAASQAVEIIARRVPNSRLDNKAGSTGTAIGNINYEIKDVQITGFTKPSSRVDIVYQEGLKMKLTGGFVSVSGNWRYQYKKAFINIRDSGSFTASASGISITVVISLTKNSAGAPVIQERSCATSIDDISFRLRGGASWLYNIFIDLYKDNIRSSLATIMCNEAAQAINSNGAQLLATLNLQARIIDVLTLDYSLTSNPVFGVDVMETNHVGTFLNDDEIRPVANLAVNTDRMISVAISEATLNSALKLLESNNRLTYSHEYSADEVAALISKFMGHLENPLQGAKLIISVKTISTPNVAINPGSITLTADVEGKFELQMLNDDETTEILRIGLSIIYKMSASLVGQKLTGSVLDFSTTVGSCSLPLEDTAQINEAISQVTSLILPSINEYLGEGIPLPNVSWVVFYDGIIVLDTGYLIVAANALYQP